ncbi:MAG TPA: hypothetical protein VD963_05650, partial [Phycisphaerales bacterium]|nr:hypothetical protein [Phycisphaerales bacterium]
MPTERAQPKSRIRRPQRRERARAARLLGLPGAGPALVIWVVFALLCTLVSIWAREQPLVAPGRVMNQTATVRVRFVQEDKAATARRRDDARQFAPRVYTAEAGELQEILVSIGNLPKTLTGAERVEDVDPEIRARFGLTPERLAAVHAEGARPEWEARARRLADLLLQMPLVDQITFQREQQSVNKLIKLVVGGQVVLASSSEVVNLEDPARLREAVESVVQRAGFTGPVAGAVVSRLLHQPRPTFTFSAAETERERVQAAEAVRPVEVVREQGQVIFTRGEVLKPDAFELYRAELRAFRDTERWFWLRRASIAGAVTAVSLALAGYVA